MTRKWAFGLLLAAGFACQASAATISYTDLPNGASSAVVGDFTVAATGNGAGGVFGYKTVNGYTGVGVSGGGSVVDGEIDKNETISFTSGNIHTLTGFTLAFLYSDGFMGDSVFEAAVATATGHVLTTLVITTTSPTTATLTGAAGTVTNISPGNDGGGGVWAVSGLAVPVYSVVFKSGAAGGAASFGDFALVDVSFTAGVPEPATWGMMLVGFAGLSLVTARRRRVALAAV
ncbi:MAG: hypothetical protein BGP06_06600 [Rhizobiales bacterium 65-9]|nr:MAG: hypothetical protein BGP06_06600 [Rhizobiales bacterium 65-9]